MVFRADEDKAFKRVHRGGKKQAKGRGQISWNPLICYFGIPTDPCAQLVRGTSARERLLLLIYQKTRFRRLFFCRRCRDAAMGPASLVVDGNRPVRIYHGNRSKGWNFIVDVVSDRHDESDRYVALDSWLC